MAQIFHAKVTMKYAALGSIIIALAIVNPAQGEERSLELFKSETSQVIKGEEMVLPIKTAKANLNLKDQSKKIDFFIAWKNKIRKISESTK